MVKELAQNYLSGLHPKQNNVTEPCQNPHDEMQSHISLIEYQTERYSPDTECDDDLFEMNTFSSHKWKHEKHKISLSDVCADSSMHEIFSSDEEVVEQVIEYEISRDDLDSTSQVFDENSEAYLLGFPNSMDRKAYWHSTKRLSSSCICLNIDSYGIDNNRRPKSNISCTVEKITSSLNGCERKSNEVSTFAHKNPSYELILDDHSNIDLCDKLDVQLPACLDSKQVYNTSNDYSQLVPCLDKHHVLNTHIVSTNCKFPHTDRLKSSNQHLSSHIDSDNYVSFETIKKEIIQKRILNSKSETLKEHNCNGSTIQSNVDEPTVSQFNLNDLHSETDDHSSIVWGEVEKVLNEHGGRNLKGYLFCV